MSEVSAVVAILGLAVITLVTRAFFLWPDRELPMPGWLKRALRFAPLAALVAIVVPEVVLEQGQFLATFASARLLGTLSAVGYFVWRRGMLGTLVAGLLVYLPLHVVWGW